jgi:hypothetical protein
MYPRSALVKALGIHGIHRVHLASGVPPLIAVRQDGNRPARSRVKHAHGSLTFATPYAERSEFQCMLTL